MTNKLKFYILWAAGLAFCTIPSVLTVAAYFPIWKASPPWVFASGIMVSLGSIGLMICVALPPLAKWLKLLLGKTPSAWLGFLIAAGVCFAVAQVINALYIIFFTASISNACGQIFFWLGNRYKGG